jgi:hypothetical protein
MKDNTKKFTDAINRFCVALRRIMPGARFALVLWCEGDEAPMLSTTNADDLATPCRMLKTSAAMIDGEELYAVHDLVGHA